MTYETDMDDLIVAFSRTPERFLTADDVVETMIPDQDANGRVIDAARKMLHMRIETLRAAMNRLRRKIDREELAIKHRKRIIEKIGIEPKNEREYVAAFMSTKGYEIAFNGEFTLNGKRESAQNVSNDLQLTAADLNLTKPRGEILSTRTIDIALDEYIADTRKACVTVVWNDIKSLPDGIAAQDVLGSFGEICELYFSEPQFAMACFANGIWQVKRKMSSLPVAWPYLIDIVGPQGCGKTSFIRMCLSPLADLVIEPAIDDLTDDRNTELRMTYAIVLDDFDRAEKVHVGKLKRFMTGKESATRVLYTHRTQITPINFTAFATSNHRLDSIVYDDTGMRRFAEVACKLLGEVTPEQWQQIVDFNWKALWQAIDHTGADPLLPFADELRQKQDDMRQRGNVESWLEFFDSEFDDKHILQGNARRHGDHVEFYATDLYAHHYKPYEEQFHKRANGPTSLTAWGTKFKALIALKSASKWSYRSDRDKRTIYRYEIDLIKSKHTPVHDLDEARRRAKNAEV